MKNLAVWVALAVVIVAAGGGWWYFSQSKTLATSQAPSLASLSAVENTLGMFRTDENSLYFIEDKHVEGGEVYQTTETPALVAGSDKKTFVIDSSTWPDDKTFVVKAHDANQIYVATQVRVSCGGGYSRMCR